MKIITKIKYRSFIDVVSKQTSETRGMNYKADKELIFWHIRKVRSERLDAIQIWIWGIYSLGSMFNPN